MCPHAGGVGLCEMVQHLSVFDSSRSAATSPDRVTEYVDHLHEHFTDRASWRPRRRHRVRVPSRPGYSTQTYEESLDRFRFPHGTYWVSDTADDVPRRRGRRRHPQDDPDGKLRPGDRLLVEKDLADALEVSRRSLRQGCAPCRSSASCIPARGRHLRRHLDPARLLSPMALVLDLQTSRPCQRSTACAGCSTPAPARASQIPDVAVAEARAILDQVNDVLHGSPVDHDRFIEIDIAFHRVIAAHPATRCWRRSSSRSPAPSGRACGVFCTPRASRSGRTASTRPSGARSPRVTP